MVLKYFNSFFKMFISSKWIERSATLFTFTKAFKRQPHKMVKHFYCNKVGYLFWVWMNSVKSRKRQLSSVLCKQAITKVLIMAHSFRKMFFVGPILQRFHATYYFMTFWSSCSSSWWTVADISIWSFISHLITSKKYT